MPKKCSIPVGNEEYIKDIQLVTLKACLARLVLYIPSGFDDKENTRRTAETGPAPKEEEGMKKVLMAVFAVAVVAMAGSAMAATTDLVVRAEVKGTCKFNSASTTLDFGELPVDASGTALGDTAIGSTTFWCTKGVVFLLDDNGGQNPGGPGVYQMKSTSPTVAPAEFISYTLTYTPTSPTGQGPTNPITLNFSAAVGLTYTNHSADIYSDTVVLTITP